MKSVGAKPVTYRKRFRLILVLVISFGLTGCSEGKPSSFPGLPSPTVKIPVPSTLSPAIAATQVAIAEATQVASGFYELPVGAVQLSGTSTPLPPPPSAPLSNFTLANWSQLSLLAQAPSSARLIGEIANQVTVSPTPSLVGSPAPAQKAPFTALAISPNHKVIAIADREQIWLCEADTGRVLQVIYATTKPNFSGQPGDTEERGAASLSWSADSQKLAAGGWHGQIIFWRWEAANQRVRPGRSVLQPYAGASYFGDAVEVVFGPDGRSLVGFASSGSITVWDSETLQVRSSFYSPYAGYLSWSPDGKKLVDEYLNLYYLETGQNFGPDEKAIVSDEQPQGVAWSPDGKQLAVSADGFEVGLVEAPPPDKRIWIEAALKKIVPPHTTIGPAYVHYREGRRVAWSPDGRWVAVANIPEAGKVSIWDKTGQKLFTLNSGNEILTGLAWPTDAVVITTGNDGVARLWQLLGSATPTPNS